jgi:hypothetical protein
VTANRRFWIISLGILLLAAGLRLAQADYGYDAICLTPAAEYWLYDKPQVTSLYATQLRTPGVAALEQQLITYPRERTALVTTDEWLLARLGGALAGLLTVALVLLLGWKLRADWWALAGLLVAVSPWFVEADRWIVRFDPAPLIVAISLVALAFSCTNPHRPVYRWLQLVAALSLLLVAPPVWWLAVVLVILQPGPKWRIIIFTLTVGIVTFPSLQSLLHWFEAAAQWDTGTTAACILVGLGLALWHFRRLKPVQQVVLVIIVLTAGGISLVNVASLPAPTAREWELIRWLQQRIPDNSVVSLDSDSWDAAWVATCPMGNHVQFTPLRLDSRDQLPPDYIVTTNRENLEASSYVHDLANGYYVGRQMSLPNPVDIRFGDLLTVLSYEVITPQVAPGGATHVRLDYQLGDTVTVDALRYSAFIHVVPPGQPGDKVVNLNIPLVEEFGFFARRLVLTHQHYRFGLPATTEPGTYDILFGIYDVYSGERLAMPAGDTLTIGQIEVQAP